MHRLNLILLTIVLLVGVSMALETPAVSVDSTQAIPSVPSLDSPAKQQYNLAISIFRTVFALLLVAGMAIAVIMTLKWLQSKRIGRDQSDWIKTIGFFPLGPKQHIYLVKMLNRYLLLGVTESGINLLSELSEEEAKAVDVQNIRLHDSFRNVLSKQFSTLAGRAAK